MATEFEEIFRQYTPLLGRVAASYEANPALRQELQQEIFLAVWQALQRFKGQSSVKTYLLKVAHNRAVTHVAYHARQPLSDSYCEAEQPLPINSPQQEKLQSHQQQLQQLQNAVRQLPVQSRQVVTLSMEGLSYQEIAAVCGISVSNVGVILKRARAALTEKIQDDG